MTSTEHDEIDGWPKLAQDVARRVVERLIQRYGYSPDSTAPWDALRIYAHCSANERLQEQDHPVTSKMLLQDMLWEPEGMNFALQRDWVRLGWIDGRNWCLRPGLNKPAGLTESLAEYIQIFG